MGYAIKHDGDKVVITVDVSKKAVAAAKLSKTGKSKLVASTGGFVVVGAFKVGLNVLADPDGGVE